MAENTTGLPSDYALDFLNAQGPSSSSDNSNDSSSDPSNGIEDPVTRGQSSTSRLDMFVPHPWKRPPTGTKRGAFPSGAIPNRTPGARRIP